MNRLLALLFFISLPVGAERAIVGQGLVRNSTGKIAGHGQVTLVERDDGTWFVEMGELYVIEGGRNLSATPTETLRLRRYPWTLLRARDGVKADYDFRTRTLKVRYKYDSGFLGGGTQVTDADFTDCREINDYLSQSTRIGRECRAALGDDY